MPGNWRKAKCCASNSFKWPIWGESGGTTNGKDYFSPSGRYEPVLPTHSWNSDHELGRIFLYELTRHSDHHYKATRKYQVLRHWDDSPQLPYGYPTSILMALVPPLWFRVMDPLVSPYS